MMTLLAPHASLIPAGIAQTRFQQSRMHALQALSPQGGATGALASRRRNRFLARSGAILPLNARLPQYIGSYLIAGLMLLISIYGAVRGGHTENFQTHHGAFHEALARFLGFGVQYITVQGLADLSEAQIIEATGLTGRETLPFLKVESVQARLEALPRVKEASVRKLYPHGLLIEINEREPFAIWQNQGELALIAADGVVIARQISASQLHLPFVVGEGANKRVKEYAHILEQAGPLRSRIRAAIWVSERRWTLKLDNGLDVRLPEDQKGEALQRLARLEREHRVLDRDILAVDLRLKDRLTLRLTEEAASALQETRKKLFPKGGKA
jgi:cell division protein FtsQ